MKSRAIVLHCTKYNDESFIASLLTEEKGAVSLLVRISKSRRAAVRHTLFQPMALLEVEWTHRSTATLQKPQGVQPFYTFCSVPYDERKLAIGLFIAEVLHHVVRNEPDSRAIFAYAMRSVQWLDLCKEHFANFHLVFLLRLTHFLGFMPSVHEAWPGYWFDLRTTTFCATRPTHPDCLEPKDAALVPKLLRMRYDTMHAFRFTGADRSRLLSLLNTYYRLHVPGFPELNSLAVLKSLFETK